MNIRTTKQQTWPVATRWIAHSWNEQEVASNLPPAKTPDMSQFVLQEPILFHTSQISRMQERSFTSFNAKHLQTSAHNRHFTNLTLILSVDTRHNLNRPRGSLQPNQMCSCAYSAKNIIIDRVEYSQSKSPPKKGARSFIEFRK